VQAVVHAPAEGRSFFDLVTHTEEDGPAREIGGGGNVNLSPARLR
jgi:hypothetical protein